MTGKQPDYTCETCEDFDVHACKFLKERLANCEIVLIERVGCASHSSLRSRPAHAAPYGCGITKAVCEAHDKELAANIRNQEREWWMLRVKAILQKTKYYDELDTALQELVQEAMDENHQHEGGQ